VPNYQKRTPSDCFIGDFAHWEVDTLLLYYMKLFKEKEGKLYIKIIISGA